MIEKNQMKNKLLRRLKDKILPPPEKTLLDAICRANNSEKDHIIKLVEKSHRGIEYNICEAKRFFSSSRTYSEKFWRADLIGIQLDSHPNNYFSYYIIGKTIQDIFGEAIRNTSFKGNLYMEINKKKMFPKIISDSFTSADCLAIQTINSYSNHREGIKNLISLIDEIYPTDFFEVEKIINKAKQDYGLNILT